MKSVLITGSSRGIGKETALLFAKNGYHVFINCKSSISELESLETELNSMQPNICTKLIADVSCPHQVHAMFEQIQSLSQGVDVLINNAGISYWNTIHQMEIKDWNHVIKTNLSSAFYCTKEALPYMLHKKEGRIINISSMWGQSGASCEVAYSASKAGLDGYTKALAKELSPSNIQVNALSLGVIDTAMNTSFSLDDLEQLKMEIPAGRFGTAREAAQMIWQLTNAPSYLTGQIIRMDGGFL